MFSLFNTAPKWFIDILEQFELMPVGIAMKNTVENSPWHREPTVWHHTCMCLLYYLKNFASIRSEQENKIALIALLFHDAGKPVAEETKNKKDGSGQFRSYAGHEQASAVAFTECYLSMPALRTLLTKFEARAVRWIIEHHLPYAFKDANKRQNLRTATYLVFSNNNMSDETFFDCLRSDANGRISDNHSEKLQNVEDWISSFQTILPSIKMNEYDRPFAFILIGASGSGKTTWGNAHPNSEVINADDMKIEYYQSKGFDDNDPVALYRKAWKYTTIEHAEEFNKFFELRVNVIMKRAIALGGNIVFDMVNGAKRRRKVFTDLATKKGFRVVAVEFWNTYDTLVARQLTRGDKSVPASAIRQQLDSITSAWLGSEVEEIILEIRQ